MIEIAHYSTFSAAHVIVTIYSCLFSGLKKPRSLMVGRIELFLRDYKVKFREWKLTDSFLF